MLNTVYLKWMLLTIIYIVLFSLLGTIANVKSNVTFFDLGVLSFISLWCEKEYKKNKE